MADATVLKLDERTIIGKGLGKMRRDGLIPAVVHDHGKQSIHAQGTLVDFKKAYETAGKNHPIDLKVGDKTYLALFKDVSYKPPKHLMQHVVFQAVSQNEKVEAEVPIEMIGNPPAERIGLIVLHQLDNVVVEALPRDLPDHFEIDAEKLAELHDKITVGDLVVPSGVTIVTEPEHAIATVVETRATSAAEEEAAEAEEAAADAEEAEGDSEE